MLGRQSCVAFVPETVDLIFGFPAATGYSALCALFLLHCSMLTG
jgi:hypothetical protein